MNTLGVGLVLCGRCNVRIYGSVQGGVHASGLVALWCVSCTGNSCKLHRRLAVAAKDKRGTRGPNCAAGTLGAWCVALPAPAVPVAGCGGVKRAGQAAAGCSAALWLHIEPGQQLQPAAALLPGWFPPFAPPCTGCRYVYTDCCMIQLVAAGIVIITTHGQTLRRLAPCLSLQLTL